MRAGGVYCSVRRGGRFFFLEVLVDRASFVIGGVVAIAENTAYCVRPVLVVAIVGQMITGAFDATRG
jgi:hypothetical protein